MASCSAQLPNGYGDDSDDEYEWKRILPPGHGFYPTDQEIITKYLKPKAQNLKIHAGIINDLDIYNYHPEELAAFSFIQWNGRMYFFTTFKRKTKEGRRGDRAVGGGKGYWKASQAREKVKDCRGVVIGTKQPLVFYDGKGIKTSWLMSEFRYPADFNPFPLYNQTEHELALCVIYYHGERTAIINDNKKPKSNNTNPMKNLQSPHLIPTPCSNPNFTTTSTLQNPNHPPYPTLNPNFNATFAQQSPNHPPSPPQNSNFIATSSLHSTQNLNFNATFALQNPNHPPSPTQSSSFIATSSMQTPNHSLSFAQNPNFIATSPLQNFNHSQSSIQNSNFIATSPLQNFDYSQPSIQNLNFIATSTQQNPNFPQYSLAQNSFLQDANWNELLPLFNAEEIHSYFNDEGNEDIFQLRVLSYDSDDKDKSS